MRDDEEIFPEGNDVFEEEILGNSDITDDLLGLGLDDEGEEREEDDPGLDFNH
jgi:hypothetical protein